MKKKIAMEFSRLMRAELTHKQLKEVIKNNTTSALFCFSHNYIDSNMIMLAAIRKFKPGIKIESKQFHKLFNNAWKLAKIKDFYSNN